MLATLPAFSSFSVRDIDEAAHFYGDVLGLSTSVARGMLTLTLGSGANVLVYPKPNHEPAPHTVLMFPTDDIGATVAWLRSRGVAFEMLDGVEANGVMSASEWGPANAWFRDPSGNWLSIVEDRAEEPTEGNRTLVRGGRARNGGDRQRKLRSIVLSRSQRQRTDKLDKFSPKQFELLAS